MRPAKDALLSLLLLSAFLSLSHASPVPHDPSRPKHPTTDGEEQLLIGLAIFWWKLGISLCIILSGGVFAGLTLGLMGLDELHLRVLATSSDEPQEKLNAQKGACPSIHCHFPWRQPVRY